MSHGVTDVLPDQIRSDQIRGEDPQTQTSLLPDVATSPTEPAEPPIAQQVREVFEHWRDDTGHARAKLDNKRKARIRARLREDFTAADLKVAITNRKHDPWLMGENPARRVYDALSTLLRDAEQVERLRDLKPPEDERGTGSDRPYERLTRSDA
jgi:hypothetical protein